MVCLKYVHSSHVFKVEWTIVKGISKKTRVIQENKKQNNIIKIEIKLKIKVVWVYIFVTIIFEYLIIIYYFQSIIHLYMYYYNVFVRNSNINDFIFDCKCTMYIHTRITCIALILIQFGTSSYPKCEISTISI